MLRVKLFWLIGKLLGITEMKETVFAAGESSGVVVMIKDVDVIWFIDRTRVNLADFLSRRGSGKIVRCEGNPNECVKAYHIPKR